MSEWYNPNEGTWIIRGNFSGSHLLKGSGAIIESASGKGTVVIVADSENARVFSNGAFQYEHPLVGQSITGSDIELLAAGSGTIPDVTFIPEKLSDEFATSRATGNVEIAYSATVFLRNLLYGNGEEGVLYVPQPVVDGEQVLYQNSTGDVFASDGGDPVGQVIDLSGNLFDATQSVSAARPVYLTSPDRIRLDGVDDNLLIDFGSAFTGEVFQGTPRGIIHMEVSTADGEWSLVEDPMYVPDSGEITGVVAVEGSVDAAREQAIEEYLIDRGAGTDFSGVTSMQAWFRSRTDITKIYSGNWNTANVTSFGYFARDCSSLTAVTVNGGMGNPFADSPCTNYELAFTNTNLTQQSIDDILVAIEAAGTSNGRFDQSGGSAPSSVGEAAIDALRARGWTVYVTGGYTPYTILYDSTTGSALVDGQNRIVAVNLGE